ncbi:MAG: NAD(P)(+) transhydrogenase (Re/Si-specific) subunit beta, partial [Saprospiraceae bacterium]|nr:NAD(P)(+) transhydrogenase (Re/Si-specific) subunit beta [Saprospiraceae bacterium]
MEHLLTLIYLIASITFMVGLKMLSKPDTARKGNLIAAGGMTLAIFATIFMYTDAQGNHLGNLMYIFLALIVGTVIGWIMAKRVQMTAMP